MPTLMKGHTWKAHKGKMTYPCVAEVKRDEIRCHVKVHPQSYLGTHPVKFLSYAGKPLANMQMFAAQFIVLSRAVGLLEFDCGFEVNGNFADSYRWVRSTRGVPNDLLFAHKAFVLYDLPEQGDKPYSLRAEHFGEVLDRAPWLEVPYAVRCHSPEEVEAFYAEMLAAGYEGAMVKTFEHLYEPGKRTYGWLKMKPEEDADGVVVGFIEAECRKDQPEKGLRVGDKLGRAGSVLVRCEDGSEAAPHGIPHDLGREMHLHPERFLGEWCEFKYMERDRQGGYRHPRWFRLREAKA